MRRMGPTWRARLGAVALALAALAAPAAALAEDTCVHTTVDGGWTFVLHKLKPKPGKSGAVDGYAVRDGDSLMWPISGGYIAFPSELFLGITRYASGLTPLGTGGITYQTSFHQLSAPLDPGSPGTDWLWTRTSGGTITNDSGTTQRVDCTTVPKVPKQFAK